MLPQCLSEFHTNSRRDVGALFHGKLILLEGVSTELKVGKSLSDTILSARRCLRLAHAQG